MKMAAKCFVQGLIFKAVVKAWLKTNDHIFRRFDFKGSCVTAEILNSITEWILLRYLDESHYGMRLKAAEPMILPFMIFNLYLC